VSIRILLVEDHTMVRQTLHRFLESQKDFLLVGETGDGIEVLELAEKHRPHVVVLDLMLPGLHGVEVIRRLRQRCPRTQTLVLSMHQDHEYVAKALTYGALGYVVKQASIEHLLSGVREVAAGRRYLSPPLSLEDVELLMSRGPAGSLDPYDTLTKREREVLQLVAEGHTNAAVGARLGIGERTVETHRAHTMSKLGLNNHADLVRFAIECNLLPLKPQTPDAAGPAPGSDTPRPRSGRAELGRSAHADGDPEPKGSKSGPA
jgi:two-component system, NarL family, response regulator NreC